jgi:hypothetical protein
VAVLVPGGRLRALRGGPARHGLAVACREARCGVSGMTARDWEAVAIVGVPLLVAAVVLLGAGRVVDLIERRRTRRDRARWVEDGEDW